MARAKSKTTDGSGGAKPATGIPRLQQKFQAEILPELAEKLGRKNRLSLPRLVKVTVNMGVGEANQDKKFLEQAAEALA